jgi:hypothetical protein
MKTVIFLLLLICLSTGCSRIEVRVNGFTSTGTALQLPAHTSIAVAEDPNAQNPIFEKEIAGKIQKLLSSKGYSLPSSEKTEYNFTFHYGIDSGRTITGAMPIHHPVGPVTAHPYYGAGYTTYMPYSHTVYTRWLILYLTDAKKFKETRKIEHVWIGEVISSGSSTDLRSVINYMLVAAFDHFGENTKKQIRKMLPEDDERVKLLMEN